MNNLLKRSDGETRRVGVELEFSGLDLETISRIVNEEFGGKAKRISDYETLIEDTEFGEFRIELDFAYLKKLGREADPGLDEEDLELEDLPEKLLAAVAEQVVPFEVVTPPIPMDRLDTLDPMIERLRSEGALGTRRSAIYAFGLHMNPEMPKLDADTVLAYLRAFMCLYDWLERAGNVDWSRQLTPYIQPYPKEYVRKVTDFSYSPDLNLLIDDYLEENPVRNRALDMLPLFAHLDEPRVRKVVDDDRVKPRPTLHYRLPNCDIDVDGWGVSTPWSDWIQVELLANDEKRLKKMCRGFRRYLDSRIATLTGNWSKDCERWLADPDDFNDGA